MCCCIFRIFFCVYETFFFPFLSRKPGAKSHGYSEWRLHYQILNCQRLTSAIGLYRVSTWALVCIVNLRTDIVSAEGNRSSCLHLPKNKIPFKEEKKSYLLINNIAFTISHFVTDFLPAGRRKCNKSGKKSATSITSLNCMFFKNTIR